jgi:hypothetical protein
MKAAGDNPHVKEAGANLGKTALTVTKTINNVLMPIAAVNFAFDKARKYFAEHFQQDLSAKTSAIPTEDLIEPKPSVAGPALQGLAFTHEEQNLKEMYLSLLATSMDGRIAAEAHPAFVEIIKQLTSDEAHLLQDLLRIEKPLPIAEVRVATTGEEGWQTLERHLMGLFNTVTGEPIENPRQAAMIDNWVRLGLIEVDYGKWVTGKDAYVWVDKRPEYLKLKDQNETDTAKISFGRGVVARTALGIQFGRAVGLL